MIVCVDKNSRTCLEVARSGMAVRYIPMANDGLTVLSLGQHDFDDRFQPITGYPVAKAARKFLEAADMFGADEKALDALAQVIKVPTELRVKILSRRGGVEVKADGEVVAKPRGFQKVAGTGKNAKVRALIMAGGKTEAAMLAELQQELGESKVRAYDFVWHRRDLTNKGFNPPPALKD